MAGEEEAGVGEVPSAAVATSERTSKEGEFLQQARLSVIQRGPPLGSTAVDRPGHSEEIQSYGK